jgi:hypothetical protein
MIHETSALQIAADLFVFTCREGCGYSFSVEVVDGVLDYANRELIEAGDESAEHRGGLGGLVVSDTEVTQ